MVTGIYFVFTLLILIITVYTDVNDKGNTFFGVVLGVMFSSLVVGITREIMPPIQPIDVYRGNTTLEITYRDSIPVDTVVVWKEDIK